VAATDGSDDNKVDNFEFLVRLRPGSDPIEFNSTIILFDTSVSSQYLEYGGVGTVASRAIYRIHYTEKSRDFRDDYLSSSTEIARIYIISDIHVGENKKARIRIMPEEGEDTVLTVTTPEVMVDERIELWPV